MVFSAPFIPSVFAALFNVLCSSWIEETVSLNHKVMRILLAATAQLFHYCPWLLTFACPMLQSEEIWAPFLRCKDRFQYFYEAQQVCPWPQESLVPDSYPKADKPKWMKSDHPKLPVVKYFLMSQFHKLLLFKERWPKLTKSHASDSLPSKAIFLENSDSKGQN